MANQSYAREQRFLSTVDLFYDNNYSYPLSSQVTIDSHVLGDCFAAIIQDHGARGNRISLNVDHSQYPYFFMYLMGGSLAYQSGNELSLKEWILNQDDNSVSPSNLFKSALKINNGNIFKTFLTIHELLRNEARYFLDSINYDSSSELKTEFFNKFLDIRGDLEERNPIYYHGDHSGSWYRIWGTIAYSMFNATESGFYISIGNEYLPALELTHFSRVNGELISSFAELVKYPMDWLTSETWIEPDKRKSEINKKGVRTLDRMLSRIAAEEELLEDDVCPEQKYLKIRSKK